jgi:hypothetical protein
MEYLPNQPNPDEPIGGTGFTPSEPWMCGNEGCNSDKVYPVEWEECDPTHWEMLCRCPDCTSQKTFIHPDEIADRFNEELNRSNDTIAEDIIRLQSVKLAEIVDLVAAGTREGDELTKEVIDLSYCNDCEKDFVQIAHSEQISPNYYEVSCRCPECEAVTTDIHHEANIDRFNANFDERQLSLTKDLNRLAEFIRKEEIEKFTNALQQGNILPEDF